MINWITQNLTTAPLWIQAPIVFAVVIPLCAVLAVVLLWGVNRVAGQFYKWRGRRRIGDRGTGH